MRDDNGILGGVPGEYIAKASQTLPDASKTDAHRLSATVDTTALWLGVVRITFERTQHRRGKHAWHSWVAVHAEKV